MLSNPTRPKLASTPSLPPGSLLNADASNVEVGGALGKVFAAGAWGARSGAAFAAAAGAASLFVEVAASGSSACSSEADAFSSASGVAGCVWASASVACAGASVCCCSVAAAFALSAKAEPTSGICSDAIARQTRTATAFCAILRTLYLFLESFMCIPCVSGRRLISRPPHLWSSCVGARPRRR